MSFRKLPNYLRSYRKRLGFSEDEVAFLLGVRHGTQVSRYELFRRVPGLPTALGFYAIFRASPPELFGGQYQQVERGVRRRAQRLLSRLAGAPTDHTITRKLAWLRLLAGHPKPSPES